MGRKQASDKCNIMTARFQTSRPWFNPCKPGFVLVAACIFLICGAARAQIVWEQSYQAGSTDTNGAYMGGSQMMHLVPYKGSLCAGLSYWVDARNDYLYGAGTNVNPEYNKRLTELRRKSVEEFRKKDGIFIDHLPPPKGL